MSGGSALCWGRRHGRVVVDTSRCLGNAPPKKDVERLITTRTWPRGSALGAPAAFTAGAGRWPPTSTPDGDRTREEPGQASGTERVGVGVEPWDERGVEPRPLKTLK